MSKITKGYKAMLEEAGSRVEHMSAGEVQACLSDPNIVIVDLRDPRELEREGRIPGSFHCPRGMLEFWIDPESPYFKPIFGEDKKFVFHCASGWRSVLAADTAQSMGLQPVANLEGGFSAWKNAGAPVEAYPNKEKTS